MTVWPQLRSSRTVRAGRADGRTLRLGPMDTVLADLSVSVVLCRPLGADRLAAGLALAPDRVPVFAGRLRADRDALRAVCDDSGVPPEVYTVDRRLGALSLLVQP
ncbi:hypothetical protein [Kitasatospora sp. NPDC017646]|uniref:hypothetical protein n=1 Tax=Kitasatospora sp. NPDC017646 TaxID=3364024 RepID=UPI003797A1D4